jgi:tetratricopeptide (TPR) repeat protein
MKVFISYSHDSEAHAERVLALANQLIHDGVDCVIDQYEPYPPEGWPKWMSTQLRECGPVLMVCTETYRDRVTGEEKAGVGKGVKWESTLAYNYIYHDDSKNTRFIPVVFSADDIAFIPDILSGASYHCLENEDGYEQLYRRLTGQLKVVKPTIGTVKPLSPAETPALFGTDGDEPPRLSLSRMPETMTPELLGREKQMEVLDKAWQDEHTRIVTLIAWGGIGKTCLMNHWLKKMAKAGYKGARRVYAWSFYSQGAQEGKQASADSFIVESLKWFGDPQPEDGSMVDRARRLAGLIHNKKTLLVLDGMEPLQYPENKKDPGLDGRLKDPALKALLKELAHGTGGLCLVSSRLRLTDLDDFAGKDHDPVTVMELEHLDPESGVKLLKLLGVTKGRDPDFREAVQEVGGHALALSLLGRLVKNAHDGDIRKRDRIKAVFKETLQGAHAFHVMESYQRFLAGKPELEILRLMGLFDRPVSKAAMAALTAPPAIDTLTEGMQTMDDEDRRLAISALRGLGLLAPTGKEEKEALDCHPLVREYFGRKLEQDNPGGFRAAHERLYDFYRGLPEKKHPDTLEEMEPLFAAVAHGCRAGLHQRVEDEVYWARIRRYKEDYTFHKLGAYGAALAALSHFFHTPWSRPAEGLRESTKAVVLGWAAFGLRALGRLREAGEPMKAALEMHVKNEKWKFAAMEAGNLCQLMLTLGRVQEAVEYGRRAVAHADRSGDGFQKETRRADLANTLHQAGRRDEAAALFQKTEELQNKDEPDVRFLYSLRGYRYCDLLLGTAEPGKDRAVREVMERAEAALEIATRNGWLLAISLDNLTLGRARLMAAQEANTGEDWSHALQSLDRAVEGLRKSGRSDYVPLGLLARAGYFRLRGEFEQARTDLEETLDIAAAGDMKRFIADYHLEASRLNLDLLDSLDLPDFKDKAEEHLKIAEKMVLEMGYLRRVGEVEEIRKRINC